LSTIVLPVRLTLYVPDTSVDSPIPRLLLS